MDSSCEATHHHHAPPEAQGHCVFALDSIKSLSALYPTESTSTGSLLRLSLRMVGQRWSSALDDVWLYSKRCNPLQHASNLTDNRQAKQCDASTHQLC